MLEVGAKVEVLKVYGTDSGSAHVKHVCVTSDDNCERPNLWFVEDGMYKHELETLSVASHHHHVVHTGWALNCTYVRWPVVSTSAQFLVGEECAQLCYHEQQTN